MKKLINLPVLALTLLLAVGLYSLMQANDVDLAQRVIGLILFVVLHYVVLSLLLTALKHLARVLRLPDLKVQTYAYHLYPVALVILYLAFLLVMARLGDYRISAYYLAAIIVVGVIAAIAAQLGGAFPDRRISPKKRAIRIENAGGMLGGFDIFGSLIGTYRDGIVLGVDEIPYQLLETMHRAKDSILIEGSVDPKVELIIVSEKAQKFFIDTLAERLHTSRSGLTSAVKPKTSLERLRAGKTEPVHKSELRRAKPVKLIEKQEKAWEKKKAGGQAKAQTAARLSDAEGKPRP